jgi:hypothetical protein
MNRITTVRDTNYTTINNTIIKDSRVSLKAKGLFLTIMSLPNDWDFSIRGISKILKEDKHAIRTAIKELQTFGYCSFEFLRNNGKFIGTDYSFYETPIEPQAEMPDLEVSDEDFSHPEKPYADFPDTGNTTQLSKEVINSLPDKKLTNKKYIQAQEKTSLSGKQAHDEYTSELLQFVQEKKQTLYGLHNQREWNTVFILAFERGISLDDCKLCYQLLDRQIELKRGTWKTTFQMFSDNILKLKELKSAVESLETNGLQKTNGDNQNGKQQYKTATDKRNEAAINSYQREEELRARVNQRLGRV